MGVGAVHNVHRCWFIEELNVYIILIHKYLKIKN